jgi:hypothetical protein
MRNESSNGSGIMGGNNGTLADSKLRKGSDSSEPWASCVRLTVIGCNVLDSALPVVSFNLVAGREDLTCRVDMGSFGGKSLVGDKGASPVGIIPTTASAKPSFVSGKSTVHSALSLRH